LEKAATAKKVIQKIDPSKLKQVMKSHMAQKMQQSQVQMPSKKSLLLTKQGNMKIGPKKSTTIKPKHVQSVNLQAKKKIDADKTAMS